MSNYTIYYKQSDGLFRTYNSVTMQLNTMSSTELYKLKRRYGMLTGYEANDKDLVRFSCDFKRWVEEIKDNDVFKFNYLERTSHESNIISVFKMLCHEKYERFEDIDNIEYEWIEACNNTGLTYCEKGQHQCHGYDYSSQYPSILNTEDFHIPTKRGTLQTLKELPEYPVTGFYKVKIVSNDKNFNKVWRYSKQHVYTNISLRFAKKYQKLGYKVDINLVECENNAYIYGKLDLVKENKTGVIKCSKVFHKWYKYLFELKNTFPKNKLVKIMTSSLWGRFCEYNRIFKTEDEVDKLKLDFSLRYDPKHKYYVRDISYNKKKDVEVYELVETNKPYRYNIARIKPFIISKSRQLTGTVAMTYIDDVVRIHTDNVTFNKEHDDVIDGTSKFMTLTKEDKTTGLITFRGVACYRNHTNEKYTTKNYKNYDDFGELRDNDFDEENFD